MSDGPAEQRVGGVVLAAGGSTRLGRPKQLVAYAGRALAVRAAESALGAGAAPVVVVLGARADAVRAALAGVPVVPVVNSRWADGLGTSLAAGVRALFDRAPATSAVLVTLVDQPLVDAPALRRLLAAFDDARARRLPVPGGERGAADATIAAAAYAGTVGVPAVFGRAHAQALRRLPPAAGAGALLRAAGDAVVRVPMPEAAVDVDTPEDVDRLFGETRSARAGYAP